MSTSIVIRPGKAAGNLLFRQSRSANITINRTIRKETIQVEQCGKQALRNGKLRQLKNEE